MIETDLEMDWDSVLHAMMTKRGVSYDVVNPDIHECLELTLSHVHKVESDSALSVAVR
jgi:hypothetical protein